MGQSVFYMKIVWDTEEELDSVRLEVASFICNGVDARDLWRKMRQKNRVMVQFNDTREIRFWKLMKRDYENVYEYAKKFENGDFEVSLNGKIDFGCDGDLSQLKFSGNYMTYRALVWNNSTWDHLVEFIVSRWKARTGGWIDMKRIPESILFSLMPVSVRRTEGGKCKFVGVPRNVPLITSHSETEGDGFLWFCPMCGRDG